MGTWVKEQVLLPSSWLATHYHKWWQLKQALNHVTCRLGGTLQGHLGIWRQVVLERISHPLCRGQTAWELATGKGAGGRRTSVSLHRSGAVGVDYLASDLEEDYAEALSAMSWRSLWAKFWQLHSVFPALHSSLLTERVDVRVTSLTFSHTIVGFPVLHLWDRLLFTAMPMLPHYSPCYSLRSSNLHRPHLPASRSLVDRVKRMDCVVRRYPPCKPSFSLLRLTMTMLRKPRKVLKLCSDGTPDRIVEYSAQIISRLGVPELWLHCRGRLVAILSLSAGRATLFPMELSHLAFFERLGERWSEVMAEYGRKTRLCGWCSRAISSASGEGPLCGRISD